MSNFLLKEKMLKVGLTGGIGSGKSIVSQVFSTLGIAVYPADQKAKILIQSDANLKQAIIGEFGAEAFTNKGYNTPFMTGLVFRDKTLLEKLNHIVHPYVVKDFLFWCEQHQKEAFVLEEAAILFESGAADLMDYTIVVDAPEAIRIIRVMERDQISRESVEVRMKNQWPAEKIRTLADWVIKNDDIQLLLPQILNLHKQLITISNSHG